MLFHSSFVRESTEDVREIRDLAGRPVAVIRGNSADDLLRDGHADVVYFDDVRAAIFELVAGRVDAFVYPEPVVSSLTRKIGIERRIRTVGAPLDEIKRAIAVCEGNEILLGRINSGLQSFIGSTAYHDTYVKWYGEPAPFLTTSRLVWSSGALVLFLTVVFAIYRHFALVRFNRLLVRTSRERERQTEELERSRRRLAEAHRISQICNWEWDSITDHLSWSDEAPCVLGSANQLGTTRAALLELAHPEDRDFVRRYIETASTDHVPVSFDHRIVVEKGQERIVHHQIEVLAAGEDGSLRLFGTMQDVTESRRAHQKLASALEQKETLLREVHHRVKNNLQIISGLLRLTAQEASTGINDDPCVEMETRLRTMALIQESIYESDDVHQIDFGNYLRKLAAGFTIVDLPATVSIRCAAEDHRLPMEVAQSCGLIVNELVTNAIKHAFPHGNGRVWVKFCKSDERFRVSVEDNGVGLPADIDIARASTLGLRLAGSLVRQIDGRLGTVRTAGRTVFTLDFPTLPGSLESSMNDHGELASPTSETTGSRPPPRGLPIGRTSG